MRKLGDILLDRGLIKKEQLDLALNIQKTSNKYLGQILIEINAITEEILTDIQASALGLQVISTESLKIHPKIIQFIPKSIAIKYRLVPIYIEPHAGQNILCMVTSEEPPTTVISKMSEKLNVPIKLFLATYSELEALLVRHYNKPEEFAEQIHSELEIKSEIVSPKDVKLNSQTFSATEEEEEVLTGSIIEDDESEILSGDLFDDSEETKDLPEVKNEITPPELTLEFETTKDNNSETEENIIPEKVPDDIPLDLFDENPDPSIKLETENNIPTLNINRESGKSVEDKKEVETESSEEPRKAESKKLNFLEAFKAEDSYVFDNRPEEYINVEIGDDLTDEPDDEIQELDVSDVALFDDVIPDKKEIPKKEDVIIDSEKIEKETKKSVDDDFPFALDDLSIPVPPKKIPSETPKGDSKNIKTPPPLGSNDKKTEIPKKGNPLDVDKSGFPPPAIKKFKDESENETNPGTTQKISLNEKKATDEWLKKNKDRDIPDLDAIFGEDESLDPLNNKKIDKLILSRKLENLQNTLIDFLKSKKVKKEIISNFDDFFRNLENNPSNILLVSMLELLILGEKPNINLLFDIIFKNIKNVNPKNK